MVKKRIRIYVLWMTLSSLYASLDPGCWPFFCCQFKRKTVSSKNIFQACRGGDYAFILNYLVSDGLPSVKDNQGNTLLNIAIEHGHDKIAYFLLVVGVEVNEEIPVIVSSHISKSKITALVSAARLGNFGMCQEPYSEMVLLLMVLQGLRLHTHLYGVLLQEAMMI